MSELKAKALHMGPAQCAVDLGDGSERGEYVNQDYILQKLGRPHRAINLMYCYYPMMRDGRDVPASFMQIHRYSLHGIFHTMTISPTRVV